MNLKKSLIVRIFTFYDVTIEDFERLLPRDFQVCGEPIQFHVNESGECDLALVIGFASPGSWVKCQPGKVIKVVNEPWHSGLFASYIRKHSRFYSKIYSPHVSLDGDPRVQRLAGNLDWHVRLSFDQLLHKKPIFKNKKISAVMSTKSHLPGHKARLNFLSFAEREIGGLERFGRGTTREIVKKEEGLQEFKYSFALENSQQENYFTEKIFDCFLTWTVPIYCGAPNISEFFPQGSYIPIELNDFEKELQELAVVLSDPNDYERRLPALMAAREKLLEERGFYGFLKHLSSELDFQADPTPSKFFCLTSNDSLLHGARDIIFCAVEVCKKFLASLG